MSSATRQPAATLVIRKSNGDDRKGRRSGEAYSVPEKSEASDQSAGEASRRTARVATIRLPTTVTASAYEEALDNRLRQSSNGPASNAMPRASTTSASETDARRQRPRVRARSASSRVAVKS